ncbi:MAG: SDR family NAD(P)-dependent oxidoreductase [Pseudomonadota bacterium]
MAQPSNAALPLSGRTILVTGASGGIGRAIAARIADRGGHPILHCGRNRAAAEDLLAQLDGRGTLVQADLSHPSGAAELWARAQELHPRIHALVNNAGVRAPAPFEADLQTWQAAWALDLRVNLLAPADLCKSAVAHFRAQGGGRILNIASRAAQRGYTEEFMPYGASKAGLINLTKSLARSFGKDGIVAIAVAPGFVRTEMAEEFVRAHGAEAAMGDIPIGEMVDPAELADLTAFLLQDDHRSLNGATVDVNGGSYLR